MRLKQTLGAGYAFRNKMVPPKREVEEVTNMERWSVYRLLLTIVVGITAILLYGFSPWTYSIRVGLICTTISAVMFVVFAMLCVSLVKPRVHYDFNVLLEALCKYFRRAKPTDEYKEYCKKRDRVIDFLESIFESPTAKEFLRLDLPVDRLFMLSTMVNYKLRKFAGHLAVRNEVMKGKTLILIGLEGMRNELNTLVSLAYSFSLTDHMEVEYFYQEAVIDKDEWSKLGAMDPREGEIKVEV